MSGSLKVPKLCVSRPRLSGEQRLKNFGKYTSQEKVTLKSSTSFQVSGLQLPGRGAIRKVLKEVKATTAGSTPSAPTLSS